MSRRKRGQVRRRMPPARAHAQPGKCGGTMGADLRSMGGFFVIPYWVTEDFPFCDALVDWNEDFVQRSDNK